VIGPDVALPKFATFQNTIKKIKPPVLWDCSEGMLLRRILHIILIIVGSFLGVLFLAIQFMANKGYLGNAQMDWTRIGNDTAASFQSLVTQFSSQHIFGVLGIPATSGLAIGVLAGLIKS
jgi:hypothetical protein